MKTNLNVAIKNQQQDESMRFVTYQCDQGLCPGLAVGDLGQFKATVDTLFAEMRDSTAPEPCQSAR